MGARPIIDGYELTEGDVRKIEASHAAANAIAAKIGARPPDVAEAAKSGVIGLCLRIGWTADGMGVPRIHEIPWHKSVRDDVNDGGVLHQWMHWIRRSDMRAAAVTEAGGDPLDPPAWAYEAHPLLQAIAVMADVRVDELCRIDRHATPNNPWDFRARKPDHPNVRQYQANMRMDRIEINNLSIRPVGRSEMKIGFAATETVRIILTGQHLPETAIAGLVGRPVGEVLGHPVMKDLDIRIAKAENLKTGLKLSFAKEHVPLAEAPEGIDESWRTVAYMRSLRK